MAAQKHLEDVMRLHTTRLRLNGFRRTNIV